MERVPTTSFRILVIDHEKNIRTTLSLCLEQLGCQVTAVSSAQGALNALTKQPYDLAFLDVRLGESSGLDLISKLLADCPNLLVVVITAFATIDSAVEAIKRGAADYLPKPFTPAQIRHVVDQSIKQRDLKRRVIDLEGRLREAAPESDLDSESPKIHAVLEIAAKASTSDAPVLLRGESGTGKSVLARWIHSISPRNCRPFVVVNCPTLSEELLTSELFGHAKGAFTGAVRDQAGRVEAAEGGTLFLDEIGDISPSLQAKLLRFLEEKEFERLGENKTRKADVRKARRHFAASTALPGFFRKIGAAPTAGVVQSGRRRAAILRLAWKHPRTAKRHRANRHSLAGANHRTGSFSGAYFRSGQIRCAAIGRRCHPRYDRTGTHHSGDGANVDARRGRSDPGHRRIDSLEKAQEVRKLTEGQGSFSSGCKACECRPEITLSATCLLSSRRGIGAR